jgi:hypothetical protein
VGTRGRREHISVKHATLGGFQQSLALERLEAVRVRAAELAASQTRRTPARRSWSPADETTSAECVRRRRSREQCLRKALVIARGRGSLRITAGRP